MAAAPRQDVDPRSSPETPGAPRSTPGMPETPHKKRKHQKRRYWRRWLALALALAVGFEQSLPYVVRILNWILFHLHQRLIFILPALLRIWQLLWQMLSHWPHLM
jgi:hypothetical protein